MENKNITYFTHNISHKIKTEANINVMHRDLKQFFFYFISFFPRKINFSFRIYYYLNCFDIGFSGMAHTTNELASKTNILQVNQVNSNNRPINIVQIK